VRRFDAALAATHVDATAPSWLRVVAGDAHFGLALARRMTGARAAAAPELAAAEVLLAAAVDAQKLPQIERRLARVRAERSRP